jgi:hypothetical protein
MKFLRGIARVARALSFVAAICALAIAAALYDEGSAVVLAVVAAIPAVVLFLFSVALAEAAELPGRLRGAPAEAGELRRAVEDLGRSRGSRLPRAMWRAGRQAASMRELATPLAPLLPLVSAPFLIATALSALAVPVLVVVALVVLVVS